MPTWAATRGDLAGPAHLRLGTVSAFLEYPVSNAFLRGYVCLYVAQHVHDVRLVDLLTSDSAFNQLRKEDF